MNKKTFFIPFNAILGQTQRVSLAPINDLADKEILGIKFLTSGSVSIDPDSGNDVVNLVRIQRSRLILKNVHQRTIFEGYPTGFMMDVPLGIAAPKNIYVADNVRMSIKPCWNSSEVLIWTPVFSFFWAYAIEVYYR